MECLTIKGWTGRISRCEDQVSLLVYEVYKYKWHEGDNQSCAQCYALKSASNTYGTIMITLKAWSTQEIFFVTNKLIVCTWYGKYLSTVQSLLRHWWLSTVEMHRNKAGLLCHFPHPPPPAHEYICPFLCDDESSTRTTFRKWPLKPNTTDHKKIG